MLWIIKRFKTRMAFDIWKAGPGQKYQWREVFINNVPFAVEYRKLAEPRSPR